MALAFNVESWIWYAVVIWLGLSRFCSRRLSMGSFRAFQLDDYIMAVALCFYTALIVTINIVAVTNSNLLPDGFDTASMTQTDIDERVYGSKLVLVVEECQCCVIWAAKACLLVMYLRFTALAKENLAIKILAGYVAGGFILMEILYLGVWCRPFPEYWAVPTNNIQCSAATNHLITNAVLNLSSDVAMLLVGLPIFIRIQIPLQQKIPLVALFSLGIFVIISAILNKIYSFTNPFGTEWVFWYVRESSTALIVANMPYCWSLYRRLLGYVPTVHGLSGRGTREDGHSQQSLRRLSDRIRTSNKSKRSSASTFQDRKNMTVEELLRNEYVAEGRRNHDPTTGVDPYTHPALFHALAKHGKTFTSVFEPGNPPLEPSESSGYDPSSVVETQTTQCWSDERGV